MTTDEIELEIKAPTYLGAVSEEAVEDEPHPYDHPNCLCAWCCKLTHIWQLLLFIKGAKAPLEPHDVPRVPIADNLEYMVERFENINAEREEQELPFSVYKILCCRDKWIISQQMFHQLAVLMYLSAIPVVVDRLTNYYAHGREPLWMGILFATLLTVFSFLRGLHESLSWIAFARLFSRIRSSLMHSIFKKALKMSKHAKQESSTGKTVNLMTQDAEKIALGLAFGPLFFIQLIQIFISLGLLVWQVQLAGFIGWLFLLLTTPFQAFLGMKVFGAKKIMMEHADSRVKFINELLQGVRVTKLYAWEVPLLKIVSDLRSKEMVQLLEKIKYFGWMMGMNAAIPALVPLITLGTYTLLKGRLDVATTFTVLSIINNLRMAITFLPWALMMGLEGKVALTRMTPYLGMPDLAKRIDHGNENSTHAIEIIGGTFSWSPPSDDDDASDDSKTSDEGQVTMEEARKQEIIVKSMSPDGDDENPPVMATEAETAELTMETDEKTSSKQPVLWNMDLQIEKGSLIGIVGSVGSGKSSLLSAVLGEMVLIDGTYETNGRVAYTAQTPFIINASVKDNILFGRPFDRITYKMALKASELIDDLNILSNGDATEIGERGVNLSGGQKSRVSLARALYRRDETDIYLFDDPLSAVDMEVGDRMFSDGIDCDFLKSKTRLIVMNSHLHLLARCDKVIVLDKGHIVAMDSYRALVMNDSDKFAKYKSLMLNDMDVRDVPEETQNESEQKSDRAVSSGSIGDQPQTSFSLFENAQTARKQKGEETAGLIQDEDRETGSVKFTVYVKYFAAALGQVLNFEDDEENITYDKISRPAISCSAICAMIFVFLVFVFAQVFKSSADIWMALFSERENESPSVNIVSGLNSMPIEFWLGVWAGMVFAVGFFGVLSTYLFGRIAIRSSYNIHMQSLYSVLRAPILFFDSTPIGRLVNRFSKDTEQMDDQLPTSMSMLVQMVLTLTTLIAIMCSIVPHVLVAMFPVAIVLYKMQSFFRASSRELRRIEGIARSPIFAQFSETLNGVDTIRAYGMQDEFTENNKLLVRKNNKLSLQFQLAQRWLAVNMDFLTIFVLYAAALLGVFLRASLPPALISLTVLYASALTGLLQWTVRQFVEVENALTSVERISYYNDLEEREAEEISLPQFKPPAGWPSEGVIELNDLQLRYRSDLELVLKGITCRIKSCEKIGICGRTGAGKSSLMVALFRLVEAEEPGSILIDGIDIGKIGLRDLRKALSIIPQDPVLFSGTVRFNLDPFKARTDAEVIEVLRKVHLYDHIMNSEEGLDFVVAESGENFSVGQRQLICIGRALLRDTKVMLLDEATASIDNNTDMLIQDTIRENFADRTVLTIAHRLDTIMDSDRIMVLDHGRIAELNSPKNLLEIEDGMFATMVATGK